MKNITVSVDDETYHPARVRAAQAGAPVSALVGGFLTGLAASETEADRMKREEAALRARITRFRATDRLSREAVHEWRA